MSGNYTKDLALAAVTLAASLVPLLPSEAAVEHACQEWKTARAAWLDFLKVAQIDEAEIVAAYQEMKRSAK